MKAKNGETKENIILSGINKILNLDNTSFNAVLKKLSDTENDIFFMYILERNKKSKYKKLALEKNYDKICIYLRKKFFKGIPLSIHDILETLDRLKNNFDQNSDQYVRSEKLLASRNLSAFKSHIPIDKEKLNKTFEIVSSDYCLQKFLDYENNTDYFSIHGAKVNKSEYIQYLDAIFGKPHELLGTFSNENIISKDFYIPELNEYKNRFSILYNKLNIERYINPLYEFKKLPLSKGDDYVPIRKNDEPSWKINPQLHNEIFKDMPDDLSLEEKVIYIYCKLCKTFTYDDGYFYRKQENSKTYSPRFSKKHLESITPNSRITCWDFARILSKLINSLDGDIEALILAEGEDKKHFAVGFYTDKVSATLDAIDGGSYSINDLMKAKNGVEFEGISIISDKNGLISKAIRKIYPMVFGKNQISINQYLHKLKNMPKPDISFDLGKKLESFLEIMKHSDIYGDEAAQTLIAFSHCGFFGNIFEKAFIGQKEEIDGKNSYRRLILLREKSKDKINNNPVYVLDLENLTFSKSERKEIIKKMASGEYVYESEKHKLPDIDVEVKQ